jgi:hypothetical protein
VLLLALSACGDDDDSNPGGEPDASTHPGSGGTGSGGTGSGSGGSTHPGSGGQGGSDDAGAMHDAGGGEDGGGDDDAGSPQPCSIDATDPSLPGATLHVKSDRCRIPFGKGQRFTWTLELQDPIDYVTKDSGGSCGSCSGETAGGLTTYEIHGDHIRYCECLQGCCAPTTAHDVTLKKGKTSQTIDWPGRDWNGPSDTGIPIGGFFPVGHYAVDVTFEVPDVGKVIASLPIEVVDATGMHSGPADCAAHGRVYPSGAQNIKDPRSCNYCKCIDGQLTECTMIDCPEVCPADAIFGTDCQQCGPVDNCDIVRTGCLFGCSDQSDCETYGGTCVDGACRMVCG